MTSVRGSTRTSRSSGAGSVPVVSAMPDRSSCEQRLRRLLPRRCRERERLQVGRRGRERVGRRGLAPPTRPRARRRRSRRATRRARRDRLLRRRGGAEPSSGGEVDDDRRAVGDEDVRRMQGAMSEPVAMERVGLPPHRVEQVVVDRLRARSSDSGRPSTCSIASAIEPSGRAVSTSRSGQAAPPRRATSSINASCSTSRSSEPLGPLVGRVPEQQRRGSRGRARRRRGCRGRRPSRTSWRAVGFVTVYSCARPPSARRSVRSATSMPASSKRRRPRPWASGAGSARRTRSATRDPRRSPPRPRAAGRRRRRCRRSR